MGFSFQRHRVDWTDEALALQAKARIKSDPSVDPESSKRGLFRGGLLPIPSTRAWAPSSFVFDRQRRTHPLASLTPVWRSAEFPEREIFDLFGIVFEGHPDMRRIMSVDDFEGHPMRKDFVEADDYEYEPHPTTLC